MCVSAWDASLSRGSEGGRSGRPMNGSAVVGSSARGTSITVGVSMGTHHRASRCSGVAACLQRVCSTDVPESLPWCARSSSGSAYGRRRPRPRRGRADGDRAQPRCQARRLDGWLRRAAIAEPNVRATVARIARDPTKAEPLSDVTAERDAAIRGTVEHPLRTLWRHLSSSWTTRTRSYLKGLFGDAWEPTNRPAGLSTIGSTPSCAARSATGRLLAAYARQRLSRPECVLSATGPALPQRPAGARSGARRRDRGRRPSPWRAGALQGPA